MKIQKKHIVMTSLVLALATAVYINYQISQARTTSPAKELGAASYVNATVGETATSDEAQLQWHYRKSSRISLHPNALKGRTRKTR